MEREVRPSLNGRTPTLEEFLGRFEVPWHVETTNGRVPSIEVILPEPVPPPCPTGTCEGCEQVVQLQKRTVEFPFTRSGVIVRFHNEFVYDCKNCSTEAAPDYRLQAQIIGGSLDIISRQLTLKGIRMRPPSSNKVRAAMRKA
ncbi:MAG: hypothetical protein G01um10145_322 [Microgenomates group bacterium Gr01-1014_5]|nr:MAG: hypothetical protein G01um10145_322 [Microgenomates group bacterium Gr01-1014_5]